MYLRAYAKLYKNEGAMTPGTTGETVDGMSLNKIDRVIEAMRFERWEWPPVRRVYIDKPKGENDRSACQIGHQRWYKKSYVPYWKRITNHSSQTTVTDSDRKGDAIRPSSKSITYGRGPNGLSKETSRVASTISTTTS